MQLQEKCMISLFPYIKIVCLAFLINPELIVKLWLYQKEIGQVNWDEANVRLYQRLLHIACENGTIEVYFQTKF